MEDSLFYCFEDYKESNDVAIYYKNKKINYKDFYENVLKLATFFERLGIKKGDVVTLVLPNIPQCIYSIYALNVIGSVINILHPLTNLGNILEKMDILNSKYVILMETLYQDNVNFITDEECNKFFIFVNPVSEDGFLKSFFLQLNVQNHFELSNNEKQKIFEVFHKNEIVYLNQKKEGKNNQKNCSYVNHKCLYCKKKFINIYQFEIHMKIHVSYN